MRLPLQAISACFNLIEESGGQADLPNPHLCLY
jgi:hypothetical protein